MRKLKLSHKNLMIIEASFIYCKRYNLNFDNFIDYNHFMDLCEDKSKELDDLATDLRCYRYFESHKLITLTVEEYELCVDEFGEQK